MKQRIFKCNWIRPELAGIHLVDKRLILLRNVGGWGAGIEASPSATAIVAQFRDFVSGCVGFLIGSPTNRQR